MEDITPTDPNGTIGLTDVTNQFNILSTGEDQLTTADPLAKESEEKSETPEEKNARYQKENSDRSRLEKATVKKGAVLERELTKLLVEANYNREAISVNLGKMKDNLFSLQWNTQDVHDELRRLTGLPPATAWESVSGTKEVAGAVVDVQTKKRSRGKVNYREKDSGDEEVSAEEEGTLTPTGNSPTKNLPKKKREGRRKIRRNQFLNQFFP